MTFFKAYRCENYPYKPYKDLYTNIHISMEIASMRFQKGTYCFAVISI